jgi:hypothetical protein
MQEWSKKSSMESQRDILKVFKSLLILHFLSQVSIVKITSDLEKKTIKSDFEILNDLVWRHSLRRQKVAHTTLDARKHHSR